MTARKHNPLQSNQDWADYSRREAEAAYRRARKAERDAKTWAKSAVNSEWMAAWHDRNPEEPDAVAHAERWRRNAESWRKLEQMELEAAPRHRARGRESAARARRYQALADRDAERLAQYLAERDAEALPDLTDVAAVHRFSERVPEKFRVG